MTEETKPQKAEKPIEELELNRETIRDLTEGESEAAKGGAVEGGDLEGYSYKCRSRTRQCYP